MKKIHWSDRRDVQLEASFHGPRLVTREVPGWKFLGFIPIGPKTESDWEHQVLTGDQVPDDLFAVRTFLSQAPVIKVINVLSGSRSTLSIYLEGRESWNMDLSDMAFVFDTNHDGPPTFEVIFQGSCTRTGPMEFTANILARRLIFRDRAQMEEYLIATTTSPDPATRTVHHRPHRSTGGPSLWPLAAGVALGD
jgi:hypothetical protein